MPKPKIHTEYEPPGDEGIDTGPGLTKQSFKDECDINNLMKQYVPPSGGVDGVAPMFDDFASGVEFFEAENLILEARARFEALPSKVRERFRNDPMQLLTFLDDESNLDEAVRLGICNERAKPAGGQGAEPPAPAPKPPVA